jgi:site-specific DNA-methyltransferase (adenine-specific)
LDEDRAALWALRDNRPFGEDDPTLTGEILRELGERGVDLDLSGFVRADVDALLRATNGSRGQTEPDDVPPVPAEPKSERGAVYELGEHRLICGDATDPASYESLLEGQVARVVFTDPPYGVEYEGGSKPQERFVGDEHGTGIYMESLPMMVAHAANDASFYVWYADLSIAAAAAAAAAAGLRVRCQIIWVKNQAQYYNNARYHGKHEPCIYAAKASGTAAWFGPTNETTVWEENRASVNEFHPTQKPVALSARAFRNSSELGDVVLDPFAGGGSTLIGAEMEGRRCFAMELDPGYCDVIRQRYADFTGQPEFAP